MTTDLDIRTHLLVRELHGGDWLAFPAAAPNLCALDDELAPEDVHAIFLAEYLERVDAATLARFSTPADSHLHLANVRIDRQGIPERFQVTAPLQLPCIVTPLHKGKDRWVYVVPLAHTLHVGPDEDLDAAIADEVARVVATMELDGDAWRRLLPAREERLEPLDVSVDRGALFDASQTADARKKLARTLQLRDAHQVLESVAQPLHRMAEVTSGPPIVGRDQELRTLTALLGAKERLSVLLVGDELVGKTALAHAWLAQVTKAGGKSVYATSGAQLIAGMSGLGAWQERIRRVMEAAETLDAVLFFDDLGDLFTQQDRNAKGGVDLAGAMRPWLEERRVRVVGEVRPTTLDLVERRDIAFFSTLNRLALEPLPAKTARQALAERVTWAATHQADRPNLTDDAVDAVIALVDRYVPYRAFPGKAVRLFDELRAYFDRERTDTGEPVPLNPTRVYRAFATQSGIPVNLLRDDRPLSVDAVVTALRKFIIGQDAAVHAVAHAVSVVKANLQPRGKPLATFLFAGPTGVGKTELARALARFLFGDAERMVRFDMSEFMDPSAAERLIRGTDRMDGLLTRRVRQQPFCVILLDEIEKAHHGVFDLLLQVLGEGRLTDARGRTASFDNAIIVMTSNLGATHSNSTIGLVQSDNADADRYRTAVERHFRPELVNRIDRIVPFASLTRDEIAQVARLVVGSVARRRGLGDAHLTLDISQAAWDAMTVGGYSKDYGARAMRRFVEDALVGPVATLLADASAAEGKKDFGGVVHVDAGPDGTGLVCSLDAAPLKERLGEVRGVGDIGALRRQMARDMNLEAVQDVRERVGWLVAQINRMSSKRAKKRAKKDPRLAREAAELTQEHAVLSRLMEAVQGPRDDLAMVEELAHIAFHAGERLGDLGAQAEEAFARFRHELFPLLLCREEDANEVVMAVQELDQPALNYWLPAFVDALGKRGWTATFFVAEDPAPRPQGWPPNCVWGPPREPRWVVDRLKSRTPAVHRLVMEVRGPLCRPILAMEAGLHTLKHAPEHKKRELRVLTSMLAADTNDRMRWLPSHLPVPPGTTNRFNRIKPHRAFDLMAHTIKAVRLDRTHMFGLGDYWARVEELAIGELLDADHSPDRDRSDLLRPRHEEVWERMLR